MKKSKGFTLIELVGVIVIISLLVLLITPAVSNVLKESKEKLYTRTLENIKLAAKNWTSDEKNKEQLPTEEGNCLVISLKELKEEGLMDLEVKDPRDGSEIDDLETLVLITKKEGRLEYELVLDGVYNESACYIEKPDPTAPVINANSFNDVRKKFDLIITYSDDYGLLGSNSYQYYLSSEKKELKSGNWNNYQNGVAQNIGQNKDGIYYVFVKRIANIEGKLSSLSGVLVNTSEDTYQRFGPYKFDNTNPVWSLYGKTNTNKATSNALINAKYATKNDVVTITFRATDDNFKESTLTIDDIKIYVGSEEVTKGENVKLSSGKKVTKGIEYTLTLENLTGNGKISISINSKTAKDQAGNESLATIINSGIIVDNLGPEIAFDPNKNTTYLKSQSSKITANDASGVAQIKYIWSKITEPNKNDLKNSGTSITNGGTATKNTETGTYYLCAYAKDILGNETVKCSEEFNLDNSGPSITFSPNGNTTYLKSQSTTVTATDHVTIQELKYVWSTSNTASAKTGTAFTNGSTITKNTETGTYYLCIYAKDSLGNESNTCSKGFNLDNSGPSIAFGTNGNTTYAKSQSSKVTATDHVTIQELKYVWSTSNTASAKNGTAFTNGGTITKNTETGTYYLCIYAKDSLGNESNKCSNAFNLDNSGPSISFSPNGNSTYAKSQSSKVTATDHVTIKELKYVWVSNTVNAANAKTGTAFTNGGTITKNTETGTYYLCAYAKDSLGNETNKCSNAFNLDNQAPGVTASASGTTISFTLTDNVGLSGYAITTSTATPTSWTAASGTSKTGTSTQSSSGTYYVHVKDTAGNTNRSSALTISVCSYTPGQVWNFNYNGTDGTDGSIQELKACPGYYKLEVWGAQGGSKGGKGGYSSGIYQVTTATNFYIGVGGLGQGMTEKRASNEGSLPAYPYGGYNGGGGGTYLDVEKLKKKGGNAVRGGAGGGATHIVIGTNRGLLRYYENNKNEVLIVAGGGGGKFNHYGWDDNGVIDRSGAGGAGGGLEGQDGSDVYNDVHGGKGGTQTAGGKGYMNLTGYFGRGARSVYYGAGGGGGWYGGGDGSNKGAGGGSSYIGGVTNGQTISGNDIMPTPDGTGFMVGNTNHGYAKITYLGDNPNSYKYVGDEVSLGGESFYIIAIDGTNATLFAKYNLLVGKNCPNSNASKCTDISSPTGRQDATALGYGSAYPSVGVVVFNVSASGTTKNYWSGSTYPTNVYEDRASIKTYVDNYATYLRSKGVDVKSSRLITLDELKKLGCTTSNCNNVPSWVYNTSYWTSTASANDKLYAIRRNKSIYKAAYTETKFYGVRPVIVVPVSSL